MKGVILIIVAVVFAIGTISWCSWLTSRISYLDDRADKAYSTSFDRNQKTQELIKALEKRVNGLETQTKGLLTYQNKLKVDDITKFADRNYEGPFEKCSSDSDCGPEGICSDSGCTIKCKNDLDCTEVDPALLPPSLYGVSPKCLENKCAPVVDEDPVMKGENGEVIWSISRTPQAVPKSACIYDKSAFGGCIANCAGLGWNGMTKKDSKCVYASPNPNLI